MEYIVRFNKVRLKSLIDDYEPKLIMSSGKFKKDYIGQIGRVVEYNCKRALYTIRFLDGVMTVVEPCQIEGVEE